MNYLDFKDRYERFGCFSIHSITENGDNTLHSNLRRWVADGRIIRIRNGWYCFPGYLEKSSNLLVAANKIYTPSYVSLHYALSYYEIIPETVKTVTCVSTLKTQEFIAYPYAFSYKNVKQGLMFGYETRRIESGGAFLMASKEKAIIDLLYLYPEYRSESDMLELRFDDEIMEEDINWNLMSEYAERIGNKALNRRINTLIKAYHA